VQVCYADVPRPQTAQSCGANSFDARQTNLTEMYWYRQLTEMYCSHQYTEMYWSRQYQF